MPNVLDAGPLRALAQRAAEKIKDDAVRARFERLAFDRLLHDDRNFRPATPVELATAPEWVRRVLARGETLVVFKLCRSASIRLHNTARYLAATCELAAANSARQRNFGTVIDEAREFLAKIDRATLDVIATKAHRFAHTLADLDAEGDYDDVCEARQVTATCKRVWHRTTSVAALRAVGREFHNCLARPPHSHHHAGGLRMGLRQYWVLRDDEGKGLIVAMAGAPQATHFIEVRAPRNAYPRGHQMDLERLAKAIGIPPDPPPPPFVAEAVSEALFRRYAEMLEIDGLRPPLPARVTAS